MATQPNDLVDFTEDDPTLDLDGDDEPSEQQGDEAADEDEQTPPPADDEQDEITFGDQAVSAGEEEPEGVRNLRKRLREREDEIRQLKGAKPADDIGEKPTMESCDYDDERYDRELLAWHERKRKADEAASEQERLNEAVTEAVQASQRAFEQQRAGLKVAGYDAAHDAVVEALPEMFRNAINVAAGNKAAALVYYLGTHGDELDKLKALDPRKITDLIRLSGEVGRMAEKINVKRKPTTQPETLHRGTSGGGSGKDARREALWNAALKNNDFSAVNRYDAAKGK